MRVRDCMRRYFFAVCATETNSRSHKDSSVETLPGSNCQAPGILVATADQRVIAHLARLVYINFMAMEIWYVTLFFIQLQL